MAYTGRKPIDGVGLGLRRDFIHDVPDDAAIDFFEIAPENWIGLGGAYGKRLRRLTERFPFTCHGLSLDLGGPRPLDADYLQQLKRFFRSHDIHCFTEHLSYCGDEQGLLYDLMPMPFTEEAVHYVAGRIHQVQDTLEQKIGIENISFYAQTQSDMTEAEFVNAVIDEADCGLLLDVNNTFVNATNHRYDPQTFIEAMPGERIMYLHMAGHFDEAEDLKVDTHGQDIQAEVWELLDFTYQTHGLKPTLLERDFNIPPLPDLMEEVNDIRVHQNRWRTSRQQKAS